MWKKSILTELLSAFGESPVAAFLRREQTAYILLNASHILSIGLVIGAIGTLDLRLLGAFRKYALSELGPLLAGVAAAGVGCAAATGLLLFSVRPIAYAENPAFLTKLAFVGLAVANALLLRSGPPWRRALAHGEVGAALRAHAVLSLFLWASAVIAGRWIGFLQ